jgi:hypothetical protein
MWCFVLSGLLKLKVGSTTAMETLLTHRAGAQEKETIKKLQRKATALWWQPGHPGWAIWPVDTHQFMQDMSTPVRTTPPPPPFDPFNAEPGEDLTVPSCCLP